jgi:nucleotide-binding universal stress UspA family protein
MTRRIVCGIDGSSGSRRAASVASLLASDLDSRAFLVGVTGVGRLFRPLRLPRVRPARQWRRMLRSLAEEHCFPEGTEVQLQAGDPAEALMAVAKEQDAELLVVGCRGQKRVRGALLGSVTSALMGEAPCPVVVVPPATVVPLDAASMQPVVCGVAGKDTDIALLRLAEDLARRLGGNLHAVHAYEEGALPASAPGPQRKLNDMLHRSGVDARGTVLPLPAPEALNRIAREENGRLLVVGSRGRGEPHSVPHGSVPTRLAAEGTIPVLVLPPGARLDQGSGHYELAVGAA